MKGIRSAQSGHPLVCLVCEGVKNQRDFEEVGTGGAWVQNNIELSPIGEWVAEMKGIARSRGEVFNPALWPEEDQYDKERPMGRVIMQRDQGMVVGAKKDEEAPVEAEEPRERSAPIDGEIHPADEIFKWLKKDHSSIVNMKVTPQGLSQSAMRETSSVDPTSSRCSQP